MTQRTQRPALASETQRHLGGRQLLSEYKARSRPDSQTCRHSKLQWLFWGFRLRKKKALSISENRYCAALPDVEEAGDFKRHHIKRGNELRTTVTMNHSRSELSCLSAKERYQSTPAIVTAIFSYYKRGQRWDVPGSAETDVTQRASTSTTQLRALRGETNCC